MPIGKKKYVKRKKKITKSKSVPKEATKLLAIENSAIASGPGLVKKFYDKVGVKRIYTPFHTFGYSQIKRMEKNQINSHAGLSPKEKSYVICTCEAKSTKYVSLKTKAAEAIREAKIFSIQGNCSPVRKALLDRGWLEKLPPNRMNLTKLRRGTFSNKTDVQSELERLLLSNFVEKCSPNFVWRTRDDRRDTTIDMTKDYNTIINKLEIDAMWTSKQGLCSSMKRNYWFYIEDIAEVNGPRSYNIPEPGEIEGFIKDYKITACTSLLKWLLSMVANNRPVFVDDGEISMNVIVFALKRCKEYLLRKQHKDIDREINIITNEQWNSFLKKYYCIIAKDEIFRKDKYDKLPLYLCYAKFLLKEIHRYRPQLSCEGCHNIWIIKPAHCSRGRGIRMASKLGVITDLLNKASAKHVIQKYIEEPLLIHDTKFDIRQYYLVTSTYPLVVWMYKDCYLKFSSQKYSLKNYHESIHLTNNAVQRKYTNCEGRHSELPSNNMWDLDKYKNYLDNIGKDKVWDNIIYPGMKKSIIGIMLSCQDTLSVCKNRFELYGCDFILDKEYKPWLIEINSCPDLNSTTLVTGKICPAVVSDIIKVVIDYAHNHKASTGKFECIYRQPMTLPKYGNAADMTVQGHSLPYDYFYRGNIEIKESYDDIEMETEYNIRAVLNKLKRLHGTDTVMKKPIEDTNYGNSKESNDSRTQSTLSENEMSPSPERQSDRSGDILVTEDVNSDKSLSSKNIPVIDCSVSHSSSNHSKRIQNVCSVTDLNTFLNRYKNTEIKQSFSFSKLDDGPLGKASFNDIFSEKKKKMDSALSLYDKKSNHLNITSLIPNGELLLANCHKNDSMFMAASKIITFIKEKEKEYEAE
ncbi:tubulin glycylase 3A-like isoform X1 [Colias croceus]|uniref:tubulin glycylase 3A-like isoform X1 n=1 Tax=Colias crocea TaxID=72248 RepID=UPI001E27F558|nr:tubulin glycylase 3A-like isoform X1 [Colias croceus]